MPKNKRPGILSFPTRMIAVSFLSVIAVGAFLLMMPFSSRNGEMTSFIDALFTATSATCVTGLVVFDTYTKWSVFGQIIILALIQIGGLGLVTLTTFFNIAIGKKLGLRSMQLAQESINTNSFLDITKLVKMVITVSAVVELSGAILLCTVFVPKYGAQGIFISLFLAISAFCNAGFDILGREELFVSLCNYTGSLTVIITITLLIIIGGLGFVVLFDIIKYKQNKKLLLHTKIVLIVTGVLILLGTAMFLTFEWKNPQTMGPLPFWEKIGAGYFQSVSTRTAGFNTIDVTEMRPVTKILSSILMFIGAAPGSTGGGIKITTLAVLVMTVWSVIRGRNDTIIMHRKVDKSIIYKSIAIIALSFVVVIAAFAVMYTTLGERSLIDGVDVLFESISAFATVGLSSGITAIANIPAKIVLILSMFVGRVGPVSFALSLAMRGDSNRKEIIPEGKIIVG